MATINFTNSADVVDAYYYGNAVNTFNPLKGEDTFEGYLVRAIVHGGDGADDIEGGYGNDTLYGDTGWDYIQGNDGSDTIYGGDGSDHIWAIGDFGDYDVIFGGNGNDHISADYDKVNGNAGNDTVSIGFNNGNGHADVTLGIGKDTLYAGGGNGQDGYGRVDVRDLKAEDHVRFDAEDAQYNYYDHGQVLDKLDVNNDGWLGAKDVEPIDYDGFSVHVGLNFLELEIQATTVFLRGMTKASFDFLA